jgi:cytidine deaminase
MEGNLAGADFAALAALARTARGRAHCPYSGLAVGAALRVRLVDGTVADFAGCNVENASYGLTICAERVALGTAVAAGAVQVIAVVVVTDSEPVLTPCGACRQVLAEFAAPEVVVCCLGRGGRELRLRMGELLPKAMGPADLPSRAVRTGQGGVPGGGATGGGATCGNSD